MKNITNKDLQRMISLMGNKKPINENKSSESLDLVKKSADGKFYAIVREGKKYFIKESTDGTNFNFIGGVGNKTKNQYPSYEEATRRLNIMFESINRANGIDESVDILKDDLIQEKKFVIKTKKSKPTPTEPEATGFDFGTEEQTPVEGGEESGFDFGDKKETPIEGGEEVEFDFGGKEEVPAAEGEEGGFDFGTEEQTPVEDKDTESKDLDMVDDEEDSIKSIQKITGKLGQKLRDTEDLSSDTMKWVAKSVLSALNLNQMDTDDKKDLIRTIKKKGDEEEDFMEDVPKFGSNVLTAADLRKAMSKPQPEDDEWHPDQSFMSDENDEDEWHPDQSFMSDMVDWNKMTKEEKRNVIKQREDNPNIGGDEDDEDLLFDDVNDYMAEPAPAKPTIKPGTKEPGTDKPSPSKKPLTPPPFIKPGEESAPKAEDENMVEDYMDECYMDDCSDYMDEVPTNKEVYENGNVLEYQTLKDVDGGILEGGYQISEYVIEYNDQIYRVAVYDDGIAQDVMDPEDVASTEELVMDPEVDYMGDEDVIMCHVCDGVGSMRLDYNYPEESCSTCQGYGVISRSEVGGETDEPFVLDPGMDYMDDKYYMAEPAPAEPTVRPDTDTPTKPGTDKPSPSKRPFTPPPFIKPGEESAPKAEDEGYGSTEAMDYMKRLKKRY